MDLDDPNFLALFDDAWKRLKNGTDYKALVYFYLVQFMDKV